MAPADPMDGAFLSEDASEARFIKVIPPGRGSVVYALSPGELPAVVQAEPFRDPVQVRVAAGGDGLNLCATPSSSGEILATLGNGTPTELITGYVDDVQPSHDICARLGLGRFRCTA